MQKAYSLLHDVVVPVKSPTNSAAIVVSVVLTVCIVVIVFIIIIAVLWRHRRHNRGTPSGISDGIYNKAVAVEMVGV